MRKGIVLSVDDDANLQHVISQYLEDDGYKVVTAGSVAAALEKSDTAGFDVILLDLILPDGEGTTLISRIRSKSRAPIIVVSGKDDTTEKIICLEMGADDYLTKPFELRELLARIKAVMRRMSDNTDPTDRSYEGKPQKISFSGWILDRAQYQLFDDTNTSAALTTGEFKLLEALVLSANRALSRDHLFDLTRDQSYDNYDRAIDIQITRLRKKLGPHSGLIKTVRGVGYMFTGDISES